MFNVCIKMENIRPKNIWCREVKADVDVDRKNWKREPKTANAWLMFHCGEGIIGKVSHVFFMTRYKM